MHPSSTASSTRYRSLPSRTLSAAKIGTLALLSISLLGGLTSPAFAGPDDGKIVTTRGHVDAPKTFWEDNTFTLKNEANPYGTGTQNYDLEKTVNWVGKGYSGNAQKTNQFIFTTDDTPALAWLGEPGINYYMAPQLPLYNHDPIWAGMGADSAIPVEKFRDSTFVTDILSVDGPGTMDLFRYSNFGNMADSERMLSSTALGLHSYLLHQGTHSHNYTVFSKPGRYEVTYRTVARSADGTEMISSKPSVLVWQVGGQKPILGEGEVTSVPTRERYEAAPAGNLAEADYALSLAPHAGRDRDGDDKLTDITFTSGSVKNGTLTLYINGYFLTDLEVKDGKAVWDEMLGSETSQIQAVFTPEQGQDGARWVSPALTYEPGESAETSSSTGEGEWPTKIADSRNTVLPTENYTPAQVGYTARLTPTDDPDISLLRVEFADKNFRGFIGGGLYAEDEENYPEAPFSGAIVDGVAEQYVDAGEYVDGTLPKLDIIPHPDMNVARSTLVFEEKYESTVAQSASGKLQLTAAPKTVQPVEPSHPAQPVDPVKPGEPSTPATPGTPSAPASPAEPSASATPSTSGESTSPAASPTPGQPAADSSTSAQPGASQASSSPSEAAAITHKTGGSPGSTAANSSGASTQEGKKSALAHTGARVTLLALAGSVLLASGLLLAIRRRPTSN